MAEETIIEGVDYGPLARLVGTWEGDKGMDTAPEPDGSEENPYYERLCFEVVGDVENAESQTLAVLRYHQVVRRKSNDEVFHDETGYWMWDSATGIVMHALSIPRGVCLLAGGKSEKPHTADASVTLEVEAAVGDERWGIVQSPFMQEKARTVEFRHRIFVSGNTLSYDETTLLEIYGRSFEHRDRNELTR